MTGPTPLRVGEIDISVMVQDARVGSILDNGHTTFVLRQTDDPPLLIRSPATQTTATNKLLRSAQIDIPRSGNWQWEVQYSDSGDEVTMQGEFQVAEKRDRWALAMPWLVAPALPIGLYIVAELLAVRRPPMRRIE
jgi:hypothetical protein